MAIEVILREHVEHLGTRGQIVKVANGYARNYLLPRKLALPVTGEARKQIERERGTAEAKDSAERAAAEALASRLSTTEIEITRRVGDNNTMYGSVTSADIAEALALRQIPIEKRKIQLKDAIKTIGEHTIPVKLSRDVNGEIKVKVAAAG